MPFNTPTVGRCRVCERLLYPDKVWRGFSKADKHTLIHCGRGRHAGRGLCSQDYSRAQRTNTLIDYDKVTIDAGIVAEEWEFLSDPCKPRHVNVAELAPRFGMSRVALTRALQRRGVAA